MVNRAHEMQRNNILSLSPTVLPHDPTLFSQEVRMRELDELTGHLALHATPLSIESRQVPCDPPPSDLALSSVSLVGRLQTFPTLLGIPHSSRCGNAHSAGFTSI